MFTEHCLIVEEGKGGSREERKRQRWKTEKREERRAGGRNGGDHRNISQRTVQWLQTYWLVNLKKYCAAFKNKEMMEQYRKCSS